MKDVETFQCDFCGNRKGLKEKRNCGWEQPGECSKCGEVAFKDVIVEVDGSKFSCPECGTKVRFGRHAEFILGKYRTPGCPKSMISEQAVFLIQLVNWSEETGVLPTAKTLFEESLFYFDLRNFVITERSIAESEMMPKEKDK